MLTLFGGAAANAAGTVVASDSFGRTVSGGWGSADVGGPWTILDSASSWSVSPGAGSINVPATAQRRAVLGGVSVQDVDLLSKLTLPRCTTAGKACDAFLLGRVSSGSNPTNYRVGVVQGAGSSDILLRAQRSDGTNLASDLDTGIPAADGAQVMLRVEFQGVNPTVIRARAWLAGTTEPSSWLLNVTDNDPAEQTAGAVGLRARNEDTSGAHTFTFQNYTATTLPPLPPATTIVSDSFQRSTASGWGNANTGGWWTVVGSPWNWSTTPGAGSVMVGASGQERAYLSSFTVQDVDAVEKVVLPKCGVNSCDSFMLGRYAPAYSPTYYRVGVVEGSSGDIMLRAQRSDGTALASDIDTGIPASDGAQVMLHVQFQGTNPTTVRARAWLAGTTEPSTWQLNTTDNDPAEQISGMVGVQLQNEDNSTAHTFQVTSLQVTGRANPMSFAPNPTGTAHYLYVVDDGRVYVYDIDNNNALVKQFPIPNQSKRGIVVAPDQGMLYLSECGPTYCRGSHGSLIAYDLVHDVVAWIANYSFGIDQDAITPDGSTIYMPHGDDGVDGQTSILDASDGQPTGTISTGTFGHNTIVSLDGTKAYLTGLTGTNYNYAHVVDTATNQVTMNAGPTINGIRPFTVNGKNTLMFTTSSYHCGFQVLSLVTGSVLYTVPFSGSCSWTVTSAPDHGISLSPNEKRVYVMDAPLDALEVYDVSGLPSSAPTFVAAVPLSSLAGFETPCQSECAREGWVLNDLSGRYVYVGDSGDVVSTSTLSVVGNLPALDNTRVMAEIDWQNGVPSGTSTHFGLGRVTN
jgi:DNA-binding beta-propeller fold protein YncE